MANSTEEEESFQPDDDSGGPVKPFLEHLEDLRWMLVKCVCAVVLAMIVALVAADKLVSFLTWPLRHAKPAATLSLGAPLYLGTNFLGHVPYEVLGLESPKTNPGALRLVPVLSDTNWILSAQFDPAFMPPHTSAVGGPVLKNYGPLAGVRVALKLGIYGGLIIASPLLLLFIGQFVLPALRIHEKRILYRAVGFGTVLFFLGVAFCYFLVSGVALVATVQFSHWLGFGADEWRAEEYVTFMCRFMLGMGLGFELPVVILTLVKIGLLDYPGLKRFRSYAIVGNLVIAAFATPSADPLTMFLMALPLQFLYEISTLIAGFWYRREQRARV